MVISLQLFSFENPSKTSLNRFYEPHVQSAINPINPIRSQASPGFFCIPFTNIQFFIIIVL